MKKTEDDVAILLGQDLGELVHLFAGARPVGIHDCGKGLDNIGAAVVQQLQRLRNATLGGGKQGIALFLREIYAEMIERLHHGRIRKRQQPERHAA